MWKAVKSTALINNVDGISAIPVKTVFEAGAAAFGPAVADFFFSLPLLLISLGRLSLFLSLLEASNYLNGSLFNTLGRLPWTQDDAGIENSIWRFWDGDVESFIRFRRPQ